MPDNVDITPGTGKTIATDDVSGVHYQRNKLDVGGNGVAVPVEHTEALIPSGVKSKLFTNTRVGAISNGNVWTITIPEDAQSIFYWHWVSAGAVSGIDMVFSISYDGGTNYTNLYGEFQKVGQWGDRTGGNALPQQFRADVRGGTHLKITVTYGWSAGTTVSERLTFFFNQIQAEIRSGGLYAIGSMNGNTSNAYWLRIGSGKYSAEPAIGSYDNNWGDQFMMDPARRLVVQPYHLPGQTVRGNTAAMTGTASTQLLAAPGASVRNYLTSLTWSNTSAVDTEVDVLDGSTVIWTFYAKALSGDTITFPVPLRQPTTNTALNVQNLTTSSSVKVSGNGFKSAA